MSARTSQITDTSHGGAYSSWRLISHAEGPGSWNMAVDEAILDSVSLGLSPPTIRLYRWDEPCISVGRFQRLERGVDEATCQRLGVRIVRRATGGRGVLHGWDETVSIVSPIDAVRAHSTGVAATHQTLSRGLLGALEGLGVKSSYGDRDRRAGAGGDCFAARSQADLIADSGEKLVGAAQCRRRQTLLQQCSIRLLRPTIDPADLFIGRVGEGTYPLATVPVERLREALVNGLADALGIAPSEGELSAWEYERIGLLLACLQPP